MTSRLRSSFFRHVAQTSPEPDGFQVSRGQGIYLFDQDGSPYIDCISGITVSSLGHGHPRILAAIRKQLDLHLHTHVYGEHITSPQVLIAEKLASVLPESLSVVYFTNSGAEAVEGALKLARKHTSRYEIIACRNAYHGSTAGAESLRSDLSYTSTVRPLVPGIRHIDFNDMDALDSITKNTAAIILEPIQGEAGVIIPSTGYVKAVKKRCEEVGALMILDEIQTGMGRTGYLFAFENENIVPDILLLAKAFGGGLPLGAFISSPEIMHAISHDPPLGYMTTFGGNALSCAASLEALNIIIEDKLYEKASAHGDYLYKNLQPHPAVKEVRHRGLMMAIELKESDWLNPAIQSCRREGLLVDWFLFNQKSIRLAPPLTIREEEVKLLCEKMIRALNSLESSDYQL